MFVIGSINRTYNRCAVNRLQWKIETWIVHLIGVLWTVSLDDWNMNRTSNPSPWNCTKDRVLLATKCCHSDSEVLIQVSMCWCKFQEQRKWQRGGKGRQRQRRRRRRFFLLRRGRVRRRGVFPRGGRLLRVVAVLGRGRRPPRPWNAGYS